MNKAGNLMDQLHYRSARMHSMHWPHLHWPHLSTSVYDNSRRVAFGLLLVISSLVVFMGLKQITSDILTRHNYIISTEGNDRLRRSDKREAVEDSSLARSPSRNIQEDKRKEELRRAIILYTLFGILSGPKNQ